MYKRQHQYAVAQHFAQQAQAQQQHHARGSGVVNGPPHGHGAFYGSPGGGAGVAAARGNSLQNAHGGPPRAAAADTPRAPHRGGAVHGGAPAMDHAAVSYDQMMAFQYGVERSRTFEAFKRAREVGDPGLGAGLAPGAAGGVTRPGAPRGDVSHPGGLPLLSHGAHAHAHAHAHTHAHGGAPIGASMYSLGGEEDAQALKRPRLVWTPALHKRFVDAVTHLGVKNAVPKTIMQLMNVEGLTRENVASHLQKLSLIHI